MIDNSEKYLSVYRSFGEEAQYQVLYANPPWKKAKCSKVDYDYPPMFALKKIKGLELGRFADVDSVLFMWATSNLLDENIEVGKYWGFDFSGVAFVWDKQWINPARYTLQQCELCLLFKKGKALGISNTKVPQLVSLKREARFQYPKEFRMNIESLFPEQSKALFFFENDDPIDWDCYSLLDV